MTDCSPGSRQDRSPAPVVLRPLLQPGLGPAACVGVVSVVRTAGAGRQCVAWRSDARDGVLEAVEVAA